MEKAGLKNSTADPFLFYRKHEDSFLYIAIYVDYGLIVGNKDEEIEVFLGLLQEEVKITIGSLENFLGMQIKCQSDGSIFVSQEAYTNKILQKFNMAELKVCRSLPVAKKVITTKMSAARFLIVRQWAA